MLDVISYLSLFSSMMNDIYLFLLPQIELTLFVKFESYL